MNEVQTRFNKIAHKLRDGGLFQKVIYSWNKVHILRLVVSQQLVKRIPRRQIVFLSTRGLNLLW